MSSIPYSGGTIVNTTFTTTVGTRLEIVNALETHLTTAGWTVISGAGTGTVLLKSATTDAPKSNSIRVRLHDPGAGSCAQLRIENDAGTLTSQNFFLLPAAGKVFRVIACRFNFLVFNPQPSTARSVVMGGTLHIPTSLEGVVTADLGWMQGNGNADGDTTIRQTFRSDLGSAIAYCSQIRNNTLLNCSSAVTAGQRLKAPSVAAATGTNTSGFRWSDNALVTTEAILGFGITATLEEAKWQGLAHNMMLVSDSFAGDDVSISSYDGHSWFGITQSNTGSSGSARGTVFAAIT